MTESGNNAGNKAGKENFASRWSRRKQGVKLEQAEIDAGVNDTKAMQLKDEEPDTEAGHVEKIRAEKLAQLNALKDEDMPDITTLNEDSDFSPFMSINVSEALRKMALRKLFQGKTYNVRDGLDEYDGDYTSFEKLDPGTITADMKYRQELEAKKLKAAQERELEAEIETPSDKDSTQPQETDEAPDDPALMEDDNEASSSDKLDERNTQEKTQTDTQQAEHGQSAGQIITEKPEENQT